MSETRMKRYLRYIRYTTQWLFKEKLLGLDFTMRDRSLLESSGGVLHGYSKTDETHAKAIFDALGVDENKRILDIGCGKGAFLREACKQNFGRIAGLEYVKELANIAQKNFQRLGLQDRVEIYQCDARNFNRYGNFNVFYFFNPFDAEIMDAVMTKICTANTPPPSFGSYCTIHCQPVSLKSTAVKKSSVFTIK